MFTLRGGAEHGNVGHNDDIIFWSRRQIFTELVNLAQVVAESSIVVLHNVYLFPRLTEMGERVNGLHKRTAGEEGGEGGGGEAGMYLYT